MTLKRQYKVGFLSAVAVFIFAACSGGATSSPAAAPRPTDAPTGGLAEAAEPAEAAAAVLESTKTGPASVATASGETVKTAVRSSDGDSARFSWEVSTVDTNGAKPSIAVDSQGVPHLAYILEALPGWVKYGVLGADGWEISTVSTGYFYGPLDIQVDQKGTPKISWHNHDTENEAYAELVDGDWVVHDVKHPGHDGWDNNLALDSTGQPHTISIDPKQFGGQSGLEYAAFDGKVWTVEEVGSGPLAYEFGTGIALDSLDRPHVVWFDDSDKDLKYAVKDAGTWEISTVDSEGDVGRYPSLTLDKQDNPAITYFERLSETEGYIKFARWDGSSWTSQRIDKLENVAAGFFGARKTSSVKLDGQDNPIVVYSDEKVIKLAWWDGDRWNLETVLNAGDLPLGQQVSLSLAGDGVLHLTFADVTNKGSPGVNGSIKYARGTPNRTTVSAPAPTREKHERPVSESSVAESKVEPDPDWQSKLGAAGIGVANWKTDFSLHTVPFDSILSGGPPRDGIPPIDEPTFTNIEVADKFLEPLEPVVSFEQNGDVRAYPLQILTWHEIVNDEVGGVPVAVTFCPLCNSAIVFDRRLDGVTLTFGTSGKVRISDLVMWDRQTETWWQQLTGEGIVGELAGKKLTFIPASIISWKDFKTANPEGKVLSKDTGFGRDYGRNPYAGYDRADNPPFLYRGDLDGRLLPKERVVTVSIGRAHAAFPFTVLAEEGVVNYRVGDKDLVVIFKPGTRSALDASIIASSNEIGAAVPFEAELDGRKLTFKLDGDKIVDNETGSVWNIMGKATEGPLAGKRLTPVVHTNSFWFAVAAFNPDTKIYQGGG